MGTLLLAALAAFVADDGWVKVKDAKSGTELRIYKKGSRQPVLAKMDEANDDRLLVVVKNEQVAIDRDQIDRIDFRPTGKSRVTKESKTTETDPARQGGPTQGPSRGANIPGKETSSSIIVGGKADFELLYRRPVGEPKK